MATPDRPALDRIELADIRDPRILAKLLHRQLGGIVPPVPVKEIAKALDIAEIRTDTFDGFEGMLLTDAVRSSGTILANTRHGCRRARFTIAHELGHFLMEHHVLSGSAGFTCRTSDMRETRDARRHHRQETQANQFAIGLLAPFHMVDPHMSKAPDLRDCQRLRDSLDLSLEACVRRMVERRSEPLAAIWSKDTVVRYSIRNGGFPYVKLSARDCLPQNSQAFRAISNGTPGFTEFAESHSLAWTNTPDLELFEQTRVAANGHAITLLWADAADDGDEEESLLSELGLPGFR